MHVPAHMVSSSVLSKSLSNHQMAHQKAWWFSIFRNTPRIIAYTEQARAGNFEASLE